VTGEMGREKDGRDHADSAEVPKSLPDDVQILGLPGAPPSPLTPGPGLIRQLYDPETGRYRRFHYGLPGEPPDPAGLAGFTGKGRRCALIDSGVLRNHPDLAGHIVDEVDFTGEGPEDRYGHGTMVALTLVHRAPDVEIVSVKAIDGLGRGGAGTLLRAMAWVTKRADVHIVNMSLGIFRPQCTGHCSVCQAAGRMANTGKLVIVAVGNTDGLEACPAKNHEKVFPVVDVNPISHALGHSLVGPDTVAAPFPIGQVEWVPGPTTQAGWDLLQLDQELVPAEAPPTSGGGYRAFRALPFMAIPAGGRRPSPSGIVTAWDDLPSSYLDLLAGIESCIASQAEAICLADFPGSLPSGPLEIAAQTACDRGSSVIAAAATSGPGPYPDAPLAQQPWVIPVAAESGQASATPGALVAAAGLARCVACFRVCLRLTCGNLTDQQHGQWGPLCAPLRFPFIGLPGGAIDLSVFPTPGPNAAYHLSQGTTRVQMARGQQERDWYAAVVTALREAGIALSVSAGPESVRRALKLAARSQPAGGEPEPGSGGQGSVSLSDEESYSFLSSLVPSRWLQLFGTEPPRLAPQVIDRLDAELGPLWSAAQAQALTDLFLTGARFLTPQA
jgi:hypothetical protein